MLVAVGMTDMIVGAGGMEVLVGGSGVGDINGPSVYWAMVVSKAAWVWTAWTVPEMAVF